MDDKRIVSLFWERTQQAVTETEKKYGRFCHYIAYQILRDDEDAREIVNDTLMKAWNTIPPNRPDELKSYVAMIANRLSINRYEEKHALKRGGGQLPLVLDELEECLSANDVSMGDRIALRDTLNRFLATLPRRERNLFVRRYWYVSPVSEIASEYSLSESGVRMSLLRTRKKLKAFLEKEGFIL